MYSSLAPNLSCAQRNLQPPQGDNSMKEEGAAVKHGFLAATAIHKETAAPIVDNQATLMPWSSA